MFARLLVVLGCCWLLYGVPPAAAQPVTGAQVNRAIARGEQFLKKRQLPDGTWPNFRQAGGMTALTALALLSSNTPLTDPVLTRGLKAVQNLPLNENSHTYVVSLQIAALAQADPQTYAPVLTACANWLASAQMPDGMWGYGLPQKNLGLTDNSNSQFALLGLYEAARAGIPVPRETWTRAQAAILANQCCDGGWGYVHSQDRGYGSMTAACLTGLFITGHQLVVSQELGYDEATGQVARCGQYQENAALTRGLDWLGLHFDASTNPGFPRAAEPWHFYWLYSVERLGLIAGLRRFGGHDWYAAGVERLLRTQRDDGSWGSDDDTCFALLFLAKGHKPVLIQKLRWSDDPQQPWNVHRHDLARLTAYLGNRLNGTPVGWQSIDWNAPLAEWLAAPLLFIQGLKFPDLTDPQRAKLKEYIENGGTIVAEATCTSKTFDDGFRKFCQQAFPDSKLAPLPLSHALFQTPNQLASTWNVEAVEVGCRIGLLYFPKDVSSLWDRGNVPKLSRFALALGENLAFFVAGGEPLVGRLEAVRLPAASQPVDSAKLPRGALQIGQVVYNGPWNPHPQAMPVLERFLHDSANTDVIAEPHPVALADEELKNTPILYLTGHRPFQLSAPEAAALRRHLERGGFLLAAPCCGYEAFNQSFKEEMRRVLPGAQFVPLGPDHPILNGSLGYDLRNVEYKQAVKNSQPGLLQPVLEGIELNGRLAVVFTPYDLGGGILGHHFAACKGYAGESALRLAVNIVLYALSH